MTRCALSLGSNLNAESMIDLAISQLGEIVKIESVSGLYATAPMYVVDQPEFINAAAIIRVNCGPLQLIRDLKALELELGRQPRVQNGPREIDIDIVTFGSLRIRSNSPPLQIPHSKTAERRFVLEPLHEIAPTLHLPGVGTVESLLMNPEVLRQGLRRIRDAQIPVHRE